MLSQEENKRIHIIECESKGNVICYASGEAIMFFKLYRSLLDQIVRLDAEIEALKGSVI